MNLSRLKAFGFLVVVSIGFLWAGLEMRAWYAPEWMRPDTTAHPASMRPWAIEADCYSQLARVQRILHGQGLLQNHFEVENWPDGLVPSTTAPFDYVILLLYFPLWLVTRHPLDWAGALVSPLLWVTLAGFWLLIRSREFNLLGRGLLIGGTALLPAIIWATSFGRPRHQSLILLLMAMGLTAEYERWQLELAPKRAWNIFAGIIWGLACWTSLFEPVVVGGGIILFNLLVRRRENLAFLGAFGAVLLVMSLLEGGHIFGNVHQIYGLRNSPYAVNWLRGIAEVAPVGFADLKSSFSIVILVTPIVAWCLWPRRLGNKTDLLLILLTVLLTLLACEQRRWIYYASLSGLFVLVRFCQAPRPPVSDEFVFSAAVDRVILLVLATPLLYWCLLPDDPAQGSGVPWIVLILAFLVLALIPTRWAEYFSFGNPFRTDGVGQVTPNFWMRGIAVVLLLVGALPDDAEQLASHAKSPPIQPSQQLVQISDAIDGPGGILAPWWLSPGLLYFSGQPIVSGTSHAGLSGIVDSAKFYTATSWIDAEHILDRRKVRWVVVWDDPNLVYPVLGNAQSILGLPIANDENPGDAGRTVAQMLIADRFVPTALQLRAVVEEGNEKFKLYEYVPGT